MLPTSRQALLAGIAVLALIAFLHFSTRRQICYDEDIGTTSKSLESSLIMSDLNRAKVAADDMRLVERLRKSYIEVPATVPYNLSEPLVKNQSPGQTQFVDSLLKHKRNGFYIDCGAHDGEHLSNSLFLERYRNWTGILIEPNPITFEQLRRKHRKSNSLNACLSIKPFPAVETFYLGKKPVFGSIVEPSADINAEKNIHVQCVPLYSVLLALDTLHVDYFSLDIEGSELAVLETLPWDKVDITIISIEHNKWPGGKEHLKTYMRRKGYDFMKEIEVKVAPDFIFMKKQNVS